MSKYGGKIKFLLKKNNMTLEEFSKKTEIPIYSLKSYIYHNKTPSKPVRIIIDHLLLCNSFIREIDMRYY